MKRFEAILVAAMALSMAGCVVGAKPKPVAATPAIPQPEPVPAAPAPPVEPLSIPQTHVQLPPPQPVSDEALQTTEPPEPNAGAVPTAPPLRPPRVKPTTAAPQRTETPPPAAAPPAAPPTPTPAVEPPRGPVTEGLDPAETARLRDSAQSHKREIRLWLAQSHNKRLNKDTVSRMQSFLKGSDDAEKRGDMREANALADRALILLRELQGGQ